MLKRALEVSQALAAASDLSALLTTVLQTVIGDAGADRALVLLLEGENWFVEAEGRVDGGRFSCEHSLAMAGADQVPAELIRQVVRDRAPVLRPGPARDDATVLCYPLINEDRLAAILFLERARAAGAFEDDTLHRLDLLAPQMGAALEAAQRIARLEERVARRTADLAESRQLLKQIRTSEERYSLAVAGSSAGIWDWNLLDDRVFYSDRLKELLGYTLEELDNDLDEFWSRLHPDEVEDVRSAVERHLRDRSPYQIDFRLRHADGRYRWFHARGQAVWDEAGRPTRMSGSLSDLTQRKQSEHELRASEERFRHLMEQSPLAIEILAPDGRILKANTAWRKLWEVTEEQAAEALTSYNMLTDPQIVELGIMPLVEKAFAGEDVVLPPIEYDASRTVEEFELDPMEAATPWIQCHLSPIKDEAGEVIYVVNIYMDLSELKRTEMQARRHQEALARHDRATVLGQLTGSIAHELNQPLTGILANAQAAEMLIESGRWDTEEMAEIMAEIVADTKRGGEVIRNLRDLYREQKGDFVAVDVNTVVEETGHMLRSEFVIKDVDLTMTCAPSVPRVNGNRVQLQQILVNLIMNAIQAMAGQPRWERRLRVVTAGDAAEVRVWVEDCGPGIDPEIIEHIFEPLATWKPGGTGMGLAICSSIMEAHGGSMWAENMDDGGARVGFSLPPSEEGQQS